MHYREGNVDRAIDQLNRALALKSPYPIAEARLSLAYWRKNHYNADSEWQKRALAHAERAVAGDEQLALGHIALGAALMLTGNLEKAEAAYRKAETLEPRNWELSWRLGALAVARKDNAAAEQHYRRAVEAAPGEWESHSHLGAFLYRQARYAEAIASFDKMRGLAPDQTRAYSNLAAAYHQLGRTDEAAAVLQRALEIAPDSLTYSNLGTYLYFQGKYPEAEHAFDTAVKLNANAYQRWGNLGDAVRMTAPGSEKMHQSYRRAIQLAEAELAKRPIQSQRAQQPGCVSDPRCAAGKSARRNRSGLVANGLAAPGSLQRGARRRVGRSAPEIDGPSGPGARSRLSAARNQLGT